MDNADTATTTVLPDELEWARRRAKYEQVAAEWQRRRGDLPAKAMRPSGDELAALLAELGRQPELERLREALGRWQREPGFFLNGGRILHLRTVLGLLANEPAAVELFVGGLRAPTDEDAAAGTIRQLVDLVERLRQGSQPSPAMTPLVVSDFWSLQAPADWPVLRADAEEFCRQRGWLAPVSDPAKRYLAYRGLMRQLGPDASLVARRLSWYANERAFCGLDPSLVERCQENATFIAPWVDAGGYPSDADEQRSARNAKSLRAELDLTGRALQASIEQALGSPLRYVTQSLRISGRNDRPYRAEGVASLLPVHSAASGGTAPSARIWVTADGTGVGIHCGWVGRDWYEANEAVDRWYAAAGRAAEERLAPNAIFIAMDPRHEGGGRLRPAGRTWPGGEFLVGRWFPGESALDRLDFSDDVAQALTETRPVLEALLELSGTAEEGAAEPAEPVADLADDIDRIATLADELYLDRDFLAEVVELLRERGQVIFYGPPGTGKTFVAKRLAEALAPEIERRMVVQFHPSTSYEDFFEGYRPQDADGGAMRYALTAGPLSMLSEQARSEPTAEHVMVIDEINRGNLPRILGELLFLLEYRGETVRTLYKPDQPFALPANLLFIGTMNTADRSIALVDAALRRRFHFVPFFPHEGPLAELLRRWLHDQGEPGWVADLVAFVNDELRDRLGGPHLQVGPSHFMVRGIEARLRRIWDYSVFPYIEEQLFSDQDAIEHYRHDAVIRRFRREMGEGGDDEPSPAATETDADG